MSTVSRRLRANVVDLHQRRVYAAEVDVADGRIAAICPIDDDCHTYLLPGFVDAHVHIESSMLTPAQFARAAVVHGTVATVSDPHEIANVLGIDGVRYMLQDAAKVPLKICFGAPSCVPATDFETAGARIDSHAVAALLDDRRIGYLSEVMNVPGVLHGDPEVLAKLAAARQRLKPIDGHAPGLRGPEVREYFASGISTDHECTSLDEALEKLSAGATIQIREGSAARNFDALFPLIDQCPAACMFCSDDKHPDELLAGHIDQLVRRAVEQGLDVMNVLRCACLNPIRHYGLDVGLLRPGDRADFIEVADLKDFRVLRTFLDGQLVAENGRCLITAPPPQSINQFRARAKQPADFRVPASSGRLHVIDAVDGELVTKCSVAKTTIVDGQAVSDVAGDVLKVAVVNRYQDAAPAVAFIRNFGLRQGALASSVAHDCHNIVAVGTSDDELCRAVNTVIQNQGGLAVVAGSRQESLALPVAGLMSTGSCEATGLAYARLDAMAKELGSSLRAPLMTLSFMALLVIPEIKLSDRGLFDGRRFQFLPLFA